MSGWTNKVWHDVKKNKNNCELLFIHTPKCGSSYIINILKDINIKHKRHHTPATQLDQQKYITFTIIRHPIPRFESLINNLLDKRKKIKDMPYLNHLFDEETKEWDKTLSLNQILELFNDDQILNNVKTMKSLTEFSNNIDIILTIDQFGDFLSFFGYKINLNNYERVNVSYKIRGGFDMVSLKRIEQIYLKDINLYTKIVKKRVLITGCAGFIGSHLCEKILKTTDYMVYGIDNLNDYYDVKQKEDNLKILHQYENFHFKCDDIITTTEISNIKPDIVVNIAAMAGVRYSLENPTLYIRTNVEGHVHLMNECVKNKVNHYVYASSSSVYGTNKKIPFSEKDDIEDPNSPYAASKICGEIMAKLYNKLYQLPVIGLRFFTVYGPRGRPDMAPFKFLTKIANEEKFDKYGDGNTFRDYTYIDDIVSGIMGAINNKNNRTCEIYNLGNSHTVTLNEFIKTCEDVTGKTATFNQLPEQPGDVPKTYSDITKAMEDLDYEPKTNLFDGLTNMYDWLKKM